MLNPTLQIHQLKHIMTEIWAFLHKTECWSINTAWVHINHLAEKLCMHVLYRFEGEGVILTLAWGMFDDPH